MSDSVTTDYYQILQVSPQAQLDTIETMFRHFAQRYHPDNKKTGDRDMFQLVIEAHDTLRDAASRASYDLQRAQREGANAPMYEAIVGESTFESDSNIQRVLLAACYFKCRSSPGNPGISMFEMMKLFDLPREQMDFHLWYLKGKGWIERTDGGLYAITVDGVDRAVHEQKENPMPSRIEDLSARTIHL
jgi:curved DNA-binding protein CbpA